MQVNHKIVLVNPYAAGNQNQLQWVLLSTCNYYCQTISW